MPNTQNEIKMMWLMVLLIVAVVAWFQDYAVVTYVCSIAFVISVIQYVDAIQNPVSEWAQQTNTPIQTTSKIPLYIASLVAVIGAMIEIGWLFGLGLTAWIFFFLRWLRRLEYGIQLLNHRIHVGVVQTTSESDVSQATTLDSSFQSSSDAGFIQTLKQWIFYGNPVLKAAIAVLVIGLILLLRFATEHWQLSLSLKLGIVAVVSILVTALGYRLIARNRSFGLALEGLGLAGLFLCLFFAYFNLLISHLAVAAAIYGVIMLLTLFLSLRQQALELALMAMFIAYIAPFTLPVREATAVELVGYYLVVNIGVLIMSTLRPWKILNQIAFLSTVILGGGYAFLKGDSSQQHSMSLLILGHLAIFVWLGYRFSQLIAQHDLEGFKLKPVLDVGLIFSAPLVAYLLIYLIYYEQRFWQAGISLLLAVVFATLYQLAKRNQSIAIIAQSYLSLMLIFIAFIPPILLKEQWSVMGWAVEGALIFAFALYRKSALSRYLSMGLLGIAGFSALFYWLDLEQLPVLMFWVVCICYVFAIVWANLRDDFQTELTVATSVFLGLMSLSATTMLLILGLDFFEGAAQWVHSLLTVTALYFLLNELMSRGQVRWSWLLPKWFGLVPLMIFAGVILIMQIDQGVIIWSDFSAQIQYLFAGLMLAIIWLRPLLGIRQEREWVSLGALSALAFASLALLPNVPFISVVILPLLFALWCFIKRQEADWQIFWQSRSTLVLLGVWIVSSQLISQQAFAYYLSPIFNPFDLMSLAVLAMMLWILKLQMQSGLDRGMVAVLIVLSLLWLLSYILLRALHVYYATPYNDLALWSNALVQVSLTLLWVSLAFTMMSFASRKKLRAVWILGGSVLFIVTLKLVLFDLSHIGTLTRVVSFLGAGLVMLLIAYIAPMPESVDSEYSHSNKRDSEEHASENPDTKSPETKIELK